MTCRKLVVFLYTLHFSASDWVSEWMTPIQEQLGGSMEEVSEITRKSGSSDLKLFEDEYQKVAPHIMETTEQPSMFLQKSSPFTGLKLKLELTLGNARTLAAALQRQIMDISAKETALKEIISHGRNGVTIVAVSTIDQHTRNYIIREGSWTLCTGIVQPPVPARSAYNVFTNSPRCYGQEVPTSPDPCVFNSVIKYETIPTRRRLQYVEDDYLCLKSNFNTTLEQYLSVPRRLINETCTNGIIRRLEDNVAECGLRVLTEYLYYPNKGYIEPNRPEIDLEYCTQKDGGCKLMVAWHVSNSTVENFEFLKDEPNFKKFFIKSGSMF